MGSFRETLERNFDELNKCADFMDKIQCFGTRLTDWKEDIDTQMMKLDDSLKAFILDVTTFVQEILKRLTTVRENAPKATVISTKKPKRKKEQQKSDDHNAFNNLSSNATVPNLTVEDHNFKEFEPNQYGTPLTTLQKKPKKFKNRGKENYTRSNPKEKEREKLPEDNIKLTVGNLENRSSKMRERKRLTHTSEDEGICRKSARLASHPPGYFQTKGQSFIFIECTADNVRRELERSLGSISGGYLPRKQGMGDTEGSNSTLLGLDTLKNVEEGPNGGVTLKSNRSYASTWVSETGRKPADARITVRKRVGG